MATCLVSGTASPSSEFIATIADGLASSSKVTEKMPAKSFFRCDWMTSGFFAWPRISSRSSSPMK
jgi:hypothetical protein